MKKVYKYYTGETVWTNDGLKWFITDDTKDTTRTIKRPVTSKIAIDITNL